MNKLFIITRADLHPGARTTQAIHAAFVFARRHRELCDDWMNDSNNLVVLEVEDEPELQILLALATKAEIPLASFHEPDFNNQFTALVLGTGGRRLVSNLRLCQRDVQPATMAA